MLAWRGQTVAVLVVLGFLSAAAVAAPERESLARVAGRYGFGDVHVAGRVATLRSAYTTVEFTENSRRILFNDVQVWMNDGVTRRGRDWTLTRYDAANVLDPLLRPGAVLGRRSVRTIVLDPGHGGDDSGAVGHRSLYEKKAVLDIAKRARSKLAAKGLKVRLTRDRDYYVTLGGRASKAERWGADVFVSIHLNAAANRDVSGIETYVCTGPGFASTVSNRAEDRAYPGNVHDGANMLLGYHVHRALLGGTRAVDRGVRRARFDVLANAPCPAVLVECGFVSNPAEANKIIEADYRERLATAIAEGILQFAAAATR
jgi:N-acetylmuramoyl-L-alanine amidase